MDISTLDRQGLIDYINTLKSKTTSLEEEKENLKAQVDLLKLNSEEFQVPKGTEPELYVSEQTASALAEAAAIFGVEKESEFEDLEVKPAPVKNGVVKLDPVKNEEAYIPVAQKPAKKTVKVKVKKKKA